MCDCLCLYDMEFMVDNLPVGQYLIKIEEPYLGPDDAPILTMLNLELHPTGLRCLPRSSYPWNTVALAGYLTGHSGCKSNLVDGRPGDQTAATGNPSDNETCVVYSYDMDTEQLTFTHVNAAFNCCPDDFKADFVIDGHTITVTEDEVLVDPCLCLCLYDVDYLMTGLAPGVYDLVINEKYTADGPPLRVRIYLTESVTDETVCIPRDGYPWGEGL